jgi:PKHD-type hydroxylase
LGSKLNKYFAKGKMESTNGNKKNTANAAWPFRADQTNSYAYWDDAFTTEECRQIIDIGNQRILNKGLIENGVDDDATRKSEIVWLYAVDDLDWVCRRITDIVLNLNDRFFNFDLFGMCEGMQFTKYSAPDGHYNSHVDMIHGGPVRKLSLTLQLSPESDYSGGDLILQLDHKSTVMNKKQGHVAVFPSYVLHKVNPVTEGTRYSLVTWITGRPFK